MQTYTLLRDMPYRGRRRRVGDVLSLTRRDGSALAEAGYVELNETPTPKPPSNPPSNPPAPQPTPTPQHPPSNPPAPPPQTALAASPRARYRNRKRATG